METYRNIATKTSGNQFDKGKSSLSSGNVSNAFSNNDMLINQK